MGSPRRGAYRWLVEKFLTSAKTTYKRLRHSKLYRRLHFSPKTFMAKKEATYGFFPGLARRDSATLSAPALLFIDCQKYTTDRSSPLFSEGAGRTGFEPEFFFEQLPPIRRNWARLVRQARLSGIDVLTTVISSQRRDGKDLSADYKKTGFYVWAPDPRRELVPELEPSDNEICLPKTSSSVFQSTNIDYILRNLGTKTLIIAGLLTDQCVDHAVRDAADLGYSVIVVEDACGTGSEARHTQALAAFRGYTDAILSTSAVVERLSRLLPSCRGVDLITGFGVFGSVKSNPTEEICRRLGVENDGPMTRVLEVSMEEVDRFVEQELEPMLLDARDQGRATMTLLHLGVAESSTEYRLERTAYNEASFRIPDVCGKCPQQQRILEGLPDKLMSTATVERISKALDGLRIESQPLTVISDDPGRFVCNYLYFRSLAACAAADIEARAIFLHVPPAECSSVEEQLTVVRFVCNALARHVGDAKCALPTIRLDDKSIDDETHAARIRESLETYGFFVVRPPFPFDVVLKSARAHKAFFALPLAEKEKLALNAAKCGYQGFGQERLDPRRSTCGDLREGIYFRRSNLMPHPLSPDGNQNQWPTGITDYRETVEEYIEHLSLLGLRLTRLISLGLGLDYHAFDTYFSDPMVTLRPILYRGVSDEGVGRFACGAHSDFGFLTLLYSDRPGLQICVDGQWQDVPIVENGLCVNVGDMAECISGGVLVATKHRVVNRTGGERFSMPLFFEPNFHASIPVFGKEDGHLPETEIVSGEYLIKKYQESHAA